MMAFGEVTYEQDQQKQGSPQSANGSGGEKEQQEVIDPNDPRLLSESIEANEKGDAYASPPVIPDAKWRAKLKLGTIKDAKDQEVPWRTESVHWKNPPTVCFTMNVVAEILDATGKFDGYNLTDTYVRTLVGDRGPGKDTSPIATIVRMSGGKVPMQSNQVQVKDIALKHLAGEPEVVVETSWEASCIPCTEKNKAERKKDPSIKGIKPFLYGMHRFPQVKVNGVLEADPFVKCPKCGNQCKAQARIVQYFPPSTPHR